MNTSKIVSSLMGLDVQVNKAITGDNAFAHSSGIHQDGLLKSRDAYEIVSPTEVGLDDMELVLTARSGRHAVKNALEKLSIGNLTAEQFEVVFADFLQLADTKKEVYNHDLFILVENYFSKTNQQANIELHSDRFYHLEDIQVISNQIFPSASVKVRRGNEIFKAANVGSGSIDALYSALQEVTEFEVKLMEYKISSVTRGKEALGKVKLQVEYNGETYIAKASDTDVIKASALAYINAINTIVVDQFITTPATV